MNARSNFRRTRDRVNRLIQLNRRLSARGRPLQENSDVLRAAVVLCLGALDALVVDAIVEAIPEASKRGNLGKRVADWLEKDGMEALKILAHPNPHKAIAEFVAEKLSGTTLQRTAMIEDNLRAVLDIQPPWASAAKNAGDSMNATQLKEQLDEFSDRRNQIVHKGDIRTGTRAPETITREWVERHVRYVWETGEAICDEIARVYGPKRGRPKSSKGPTSS